VEVCQVCNNQAVYKSAGSSDAYVLDCPRCGEYSISRPALVNLEHADYSQRQRANISGWLLENPGVEINSVNLERFAVIKAPGFNERADNLLRAMGKQSEFAGQHLESEDRWIGYSSSVSREENETIISFLVETDRISEHRSTSGRYYVVRPKGWMRLDELEKTNAESSQGFVAMWFSKEMQSIYDGPISGAIKSAGYVPHRVDNKEHNNKIDDEIIAEIRKSRFVVADFTGHRGGVYYEAGFGQGLGLEVFWTCRRDDLENLHFDIRQFNYIDWEADNLDEFERRLRVRIESVLGTGPHK